MESIKLFNRYENIVEVRDLGLKDYINVPKIIVPRNEGRQETKKFWKSEDMHIVERLINKLSVAGHKGKKHNFSSGRNTGKYLSLAKIVIDAFDIVQEKTKHNPIQILVRAIEYSSPMEEVTTIEYGGVRHPKAVDCSPQRRVDLALRWLTQGVYLKTVKNKRRASQVLADELIKAANDDKTSFSITKKIEAERQAAASR